MAGGGEAMRTPEALRDDAHLHDRGFWKQVEHSELGRSLLRGSLLPDTFCRHAAQYWVS